MGQIGTSHDQAHRRILVLMSLVIALISTLIGVRALAAEGEEVAADLTGSRKTVDLSNAIGGSQLNYTIVISNSGGTTGATISDTLPVSATFVSGSIQPPTELNVITGGYGESNGVITWTGSLGPDTFATITFSAVVTDNVVPGQTLTNTVHITGTGVLITRSASTLIVSEPPTKTVYLPLAPKAPPLLFLGSTRPNSSNSWTINWSDGDMGITSYELQESKDPGFASFATYNVSPPATSQSVNHPLSFNNVFYYRVRAIAGSVIGPWSSTRAVVGGYRDDFDDSSSGWDVRRMSFLEKTDAKYGTGSEFGNLIILTFDRWDWMVASPLRPAPALPYAIEYRSRIHDPANLVSGGAVFGGDWNGSSCPDVGNVYATDHCFNHFYNTNTIWYGPLKMLFERVDYLFLCPNCTGSQLKRLSNDESVWFTADVPNVNASSWNTWRIEVRATGIKWYANNQLFAQTSDATWVNEPYFGVFSSTDEYQPSIWFFDYYQVTPLDS